MSNQKYLIRLKPLTPFFFGSENTFGENNVNYYVRSNYLPQQTTLLGMLRYQLLAQNDLLGTKPNKTWTDLIGSNSFQGNPAQDFGAIQNLSPLFLTNGKGEHFIPQAMDWAMYEYEYEELGEKKKEMKLAPINISYEEGKGITFLGKKCDKIPTLTAGGKPYNPKHGLKELWVSSNSSCLRQWDYEVDFKTGKGYENGFFIKKEQVGIHRKVERTREDTGDFYKQVFYELKDTFEKYSPEKDNFEKHNFEFAFFVELSDGQKLDSNIIHIGAERSTFQMTVEEVEDLKENERSFEALFTKETFKTSVNRPAAIILTSDAYCEADMLNHCDFAITDTVPFRNIITEQANKAADFSYHRINKHDEKRDKQEAKRGLYKQCTLSYLLKRGSILYPSDMQKVKDALQNDAFRKIGYNHYVEVAATNSSQK